MRPSREKVNPACFLRSQDDMEEDEIEWWGRKINLAKTGED